MPNNAENALKTITITNKEKDISKDISKKKVGFQPPTLQEVEKYVSDNGFSFDPKVFFKYFEEGKWEDATGKPVRNWKQKAITWNSKQTRVPQRKMGGNAPYKQTKISESEFDALFDEMNEVVL